MKRPTRHKAETLRVGEMIFYPSAIGSRPRFVRAVQVGSNRVPMPKPGAELVRVPMWMARAYIANGAPAYRTRRAAQRECNRLNSRECW